MPPRKFTPSEIESEGIFSNLSTFDVTVDTGTEKLLKMYYLHAYPCWVTLQKSLYFKIAMLLATS